MNSSRDISGAASAAGSPLLPSAAGAAPSTAVVVERPLSTSSTSVPAATAAADSGSPLAADVTSAAPLQLSLSPLALEALEQRYGEVMRSLTNEPQLEAFRIEYEKIHRLLLASLDGEDRLRRKERELQAELGTHQQKIRTAMTLSQEDETAIASLRKEIEAAWGKADTAHEQEQRSRELVHVLKQQVVELDSLVERTAGLSLEQETYLRDLLATKKGREEEVLVLRSNLSRITAEHQQLRRQAEEAEAVRDDALADMQSVRDAYQKLLTSLEEEQRERRSKEEGVRLYRESTEQCVRQFDEHSNDMDRCLQEERRLRREAETMAEEAQQLAMQLEERQERFKAEANRLAQVERSNHNLTNDIPQRQAALREKQHELHRCSKKLAVAEKAARAQQAELQALVDKRAAAAAALENRGALISSSMEQLAAEEKEVAALEVEVRRAMQQKSEAVAEISSKEAKRAQVEGQRVLEEGKRRRLEQQLEVLRHNNEDMRRSVFYAEQHHEKEMKSAQTFLLQLHRILDAIRSKRSDAKLVEEETALHQKKLKAQQELLSTVSMDRHRTEKALRETLDERHQLQLRHTGKTEELDGVKADLIIREAALCQMNLLSRQQSKDVANTEQRLRFLKEDRQHAETRVAALLVESMQLRQVIANCDQEAQRHRARLGAMTAERNTLAAQLLLRTNELSLIREKLHIVENAISRGAAGYDAMMQKVGTARDELVEQRLRCRLALVRLRYIDRLKKKEQQQDRAITQLRSRARGLADELGMQHNVHRWRYMEGNEPELLDANAKVQLLQSKLLHMRDKLQEQTEMVEKKETEYETLRRHLARMPGPEAAEDLALCSEAKRTRDSQLAQMSTELQTSEQQAAVLTDEVEELREELNTTKQRYYQEKSKHDILRREAGLLRQTWGVKQATLSQVAAPLQQQQQQQQSRLSASSSSRSSPPPPRASGTAAGTMSSAPSLPQPSQQRQRQQQRQAMDEALLNALTAGAPQPIFPLQKPANQRQFVGGGFALTR